MRILVLTKRQYMGKDLLDDRFGRFRELPLELARLGHQVHGLCLSYRARNEAHVIDCTASRDGQVEWQSVNLMRGFLPGLPGYFRRARQLIGEFRPDIIWACSDAYHAILGARLAREFHCGLVIDLYDNFEAFSATKVPGVLSMFRSAVKHADRGHLLQSTPGRLRRPDLSHDESTRRDLERCPQGFVLSAGQAHLPARVETASRCHGHRRRRSTRFQPWYR